MMEAGGDFQGNWEVKGGKGRANFGPIGRGDKKLKI